MQSGNKSVLVTGGTKGIGLGIRQGVCAQRRDGHARGAYRGRGISGGGGHRGADAGQILPESLDALSA